MPWWIYLYLAVFCAATVGGVYDDLDKNNKVFFISGNILSLLLVVTFVMAFYYEKVFGFIGAAIYPMILIGVIFEFISASADLKEEDELTSIQKLSIMTIVGLIVVPGYVFGLMVAIRYANV